MNLRLKHLEWFGPWVGNRDSAILFSFELFECGSEKVNIPAMGVTFESGPSQNQSEWARFKAYQAMSDWASKKTGRAASNPSEQWHTIAYQHEQRATIGI